MHMLLPSCKGKRIKNLNFATKQELLPGNTPYAGLHFCKIGRFTDRGD